MPRKARQKSIINIYHVVIRGADRQRMFESHSDYCKYLDILKRYKEELDFDIYAYCLMSNHVHLLIHEKSNSLETIFRHINTCYAVWFNMKYQRTGFLQQGRYYSEPVDNEKYLLSVLRYIHNNPTKAGLEAYPGESYHYSSMSDYLSGSFRIISPSLLGVIFKDLQSFKSFHEEIVDDECLDIDKIKTRIPDDVARSIIIEECKCHSVNDFQSLSKVDRDKYLLLLNKKGISIRQLNRLTGVPKGVIDRVLAKKRSS